MNELGDREREWVVFRERLDPVAKRVLEAEDPWGAYDEANSITGALVDDLVWMPHGGDVYIAWAELADQFESGKPPIAEADAALRGAARLWLRSPAEPSESFLAEWLALAHKLVGDLVEQYGDFWRGPGGAAASAPDGGT